MRPGKVFTETCSYGMVAVGATITEELANHIGSGKGPFCIPLLLDCGFQCTIPSIIFVCIVKTRNGALSVLKL